MKFHNLFPLSACQKARCAFLLSFCFIFSGVAASARNNNAPKAQPRQVGSVAPLARVVTTGARQELPKRMRLVAQAQALPAAAPASLSAATAPLAVAATSDEQRAIEMINAERRKRGERPLVFDGRLTFIARQHSQNMAQLNFFAHIGRDARDATARAEAVGIRDWRSMGENIAYNHVRYPDPVATAVEQWMRSTKHRDNILNGDFTHTGLGIARASDGRIYFTQVFLTR